MRKCLLIVLGLYALLVGCTVSPQEDFPSLSYELDHLDTKGILDSTDSVEVLDSKSDKILLSISKRYQEGDEYAVEQGYNSYTTRVVQYSLRDNEIVREYTVSPDTFCADGVLLDNGFDLIEVDISSRNEGAYTYNVCRIQSNREILKSDLCSSFVGAPTMVSLGDNNTAYNFYNPVTEEFGVCIIHNDGRISDSIRYVESADHTPLGSKLEGNGQCYLYYMGLDSKGTLLVGDNEKVVGQAQLGQSERMYSYTLLKDSILMSTIDKSSTSNKDELMGTISVRNFEGKILQSTEHLPLYKLTSDGISTAIGVNSKQQVEHIAVYEKGIRTYAVPEYAINTEYFLYPFAISRNEFGVLEWKGSSTGVARLKFTSGSDKGEIA